MIKNKLYLASYICKKKSYIYWRLLSLFIFTIIILPFTCQAFKNHPNNDVENRKIENARILNSKPKIASGQKLKASVGTILYIYDDKNQPFILIGQEIEGKSGGGTYCELGGSMQLSSQAQPETFLEGLIRECEEESAKLYKLDPEYVINNAFVYYNITKSNREELYIFLEAPNYISGNDILKASKHEKEKQYLEKQKYKWIKLEDISNCNTEKCLVRDIEGKEEEIILRNFFLKAIKTDEMQQIFVKIKAIFKAQDLP